MFAELFTLENLYGVFSWEGIFTLLMLILLQAVLGFDNLLYISIESKRVEKSRQRLVRQLGIGLAIVFRIALLFVILGAITALQEPFFKFPNSIESVISGIFNVHSVIVLAGGVFIIYTAIKEIMHMMTIEHSEGNQPKKLRPVAGAVTWIVLMNLVFSFDSILSAVALTDNPYVMAVAIIVSGIMMIWLSDHVAEFLKKNRMYEVLGLFILFIVGIMLVSEGGHLAHVHLFGYPIEAMSKATFYFVIAILVLIDIAQSRYRKKLMAEVKLAEQSAGS